MQRFEPCSFRVREQAISRQKGASRRREPGGIGVKGFGNIWASQN